MIPKVGELYVCGGCTYWCVEAGESFVFQRGPVCLTVCLEQVITNFKRVGVLHAGGRYTSLFPCEHFSIGTSVVVDSLSDSEVILDVGTVLPTDTFFTVFM